MVYFDEFVRTQMGWSDYVLCRIHQLNIVGQGIRGRDRDKHRDLAARVVSEVRPFLVLTVNACSDSHRVITACWW